ncbi:MAG TPA: ParB/RepB/Spo0J family partition protein [Gemmatimonadaceae bacterium]|nr:ParB/RepB/Spo0J family partition protein [Gemmatimonadaceae bacterium]
MSTEKPRRLGRGLEALIATKSLAEPVDEASPHPAYRAIRIAEIRPNPLQPRKDFRADELAELEASLRLSGLLQPICVRPSARGGFELIAGERRLRAATNLGWSEINALVREIDDQQLLTLALIENLQRADLNPIEAAQGYRRLIDDFAISQNQVAEAVGKDRSSVANSLRLLNLPDIIQHMIQDGRVSAGHGRALLALSSEREMVELARQVIAGGLSVRDVETRVRRGARPAKRQSRPKARAGGPRVGEIREMEDQLRARLQTDIAITLKGADRGQIEITFYSADDLDRLLDIMLGPNRESM